jgi:hypothetical protein
MSNHKMGRQPSFAMIPNDWAHSPKILRLMETTPPCPITILTLSSLLAVAAEKGGVISLHGEPMTINDLAFHFRVEENIMIETYQKLEDDGFVTITKEQLVVINFDKYQNLSKPAREEQFKRIENRIDKRFSGDDSNPTYRDRVSRLPFLEINEILKQSEYSNLSVYVDTKGDYLTEQIVKKFKDLESKKYSYKFLRAVMVEADSNLTDNESAFKELWETLGGDSETLEDTTPPEATDALLEAPQLPIEAPRMPETPADQPSKTIVSNQQNQNVVGDDLIALFLSQPFKDFSGFFRPNSIWLESLLVSPVQEVAISDLNRSQNFTGTVGQFIEGVGWKLDKTSHDIKRWLQIEGIISQDDDESDYPPEPEESETEEYPF